jgi:hypothetical protein
VNTIPEGCAERWLVLEPEFRKPSRGGEDQKIRFQIIRTGISRWSWMLLGGVHEQKESRKNEDTDKIMKGARRPEKKVGTDPNRVSRGQATNEYPKSTKDQ